MCNKYKMHDGVKYCSQDNLVEMYLNNTWRANLAITGAGGLPHFSKAGNVVRASTSVRVSMRLPPNMDAATAAKAIQSKLTTDDGNGWCMKEPADWLSSTLHHVAREFYEGKDFGSYGMGGSIPFLSQLGGLYPKTFIIALGLIGPNANAHAPNECINLAYAKKLTCAMSHILVEVGHKHQ